MIKQEELLKKISENENEEELFVKKPTPAIIVTKDNVKMLTKLVNLTQNGKYPGLSLGSLDKTSYPDTDNKYKDKEGNYNIGIGLIFQLSNGKLDAYPNSDFQNNYTEIEGEKIKGEVTGIPEIDSQLIIYNKGDSDQLQEVAMMRIKDLNMLDTNEIEAPWGGTQEFDENAYVVLEKNKEGKVEKAYIVQAEKNGNPTAYITKEEYNQLKQKNTKPVITQEQIIKRVKSFKKPNKKNNLKENSNSITRKLS